QVRAGHQSQDREGPWIDDPTVAASAGGPGHRVMNRRTFLGGLAVGTLAAPIIAVAQQAGKSYRLGVLAPAAPPDPSDLGSGVVLLPKHLRELGYIEGQNLIIEARFAAGNFE